MNKAYIVPFALVTGIITTSVVMREVVRRRYGANVRKDGLESHYKKAGIPTMGGLGFILAILISYLAFGMYKNPESGYILLSMLAFGAIGFVDDLLKIKRKSSDGLTSKQKLVWQLLASCVLVYVVSGDTNTFVPFIGYVKMGFWLYPLLVLMFVSITNAVNITDGADGLASSVTLVVAGFIMFISMILMKYGVKNMSGAVVGSLVAFLVFNMHPAKVFMGDTGSFALGGYIAAAAAVLKIPLLVPAFGFVYVLENLSVIIQVAHYKRTGRRIFKMAPLHHHFEYNGWSENKIVMVFVIWTAISVVAAYWLLTAT